MFCYQCQETAKNQGCTLRGVCGKEEDTSNLHDLLIHVLIEIAFEVEKNNQKISKEQGIFITKALFVTITNANFDNAKIINYIKEGLKLKEQLFAKQESFKNELQLKEMAKTVGILSYSKNEDIRSLKSLLLYGMKGISAYTKHASVLGFFNEDIYNFLIKGLSGLKKDLSADELTKLVLETGKVAVDAMALLDKANTETYGNPEITEVNIGVKNNPGILISGHDLKDMEELLEQTKDKGIDVYTHSEMLPANYYPKFKKYNHFVGNYGNAWWKQNEEFDSFNGPILMTTNCIIPPKDSYKNRIFTTGCAGYKGIKHIADRKEGSKKDFSEIIKLAKTCQSPKEIEKGKIIGGFAHNQVLALADKVIDAIKSGAIKRFIVMAGCDGRHKTRNYFTEVAQKLPKDTIILTAGCAKYRYNKLQLGDIKGIPRVLDAGQCNDSYSLAVIALKLKEAFKLDDINKLPISFDIAWYEQKAVAVLLALLHLGVNGIRLGPTLPAFLSANVTKVLVDKFNIKLISDVENDIASML